MESFVKFFIKNSKFTSILSLFVLLLGVNGLQSMRSESFPSVNFATVQITTIYPGASPDEVEVKVTKPLEDEIKKVSGLRDVKSHSQSGLSKIVVRVDMDNVDVDEVLDDLEKSVNRVTDLPPEIPERPVFKELKSEEFPVLELAIIGANTDRQRDIYADRLKDEIEGLDGVLSARLIGFRDRQFTVWLDKGRMQDSHVGVSEVVQSILLKNKNVPAGNVSSEREQMLVRVVGKVTRKEELENSFVRSNFSRQSVRIRDIARVEDGMEDAEEMVKVDGQDATIMVITKKGGADTITLVAEIEAALASMQGLLPPGLAVKTYLNEGTKVINRLDVLRSNALSGLALVIIFLLIFLPGRVGVVASLSLPLAVLATLAIMNSVDMTLNAMTIVSLVIALGMLVDNSVVLSENFVRLIREGSSPGHAAAQSVNQLWLPLTATSLTTIAAFLPMLVTKGIMGKFIAAIPIVVCISLAISLLEGFFLLPMRLKWAVSENGAKKQAQNRKGIFDKISRGFEVMMQTLVSYRYLVAMGFTAFLVGSITMLAKFNHFDLFPADQTEVYLARYELPTGSPLHKTNEAAERLSRDIKEALGGDVETIVAKTGLSQDRPDDPKAKQADNVGIIHAYVTRQASFDLNHSDALAKLREIDSSYLEALTFEAQIMGPPIGAPVDATLRSNNTINLDAAAADIVARLSQTRGLRDVKINQPVGDKEVFVNFDERAIAQLGLNIDKIGTVIKTALEGVTVEEITVDNKRFDLVVEMGRIFKRDVRDLEEIKILNARGNLVPLGKLASFEVKAGTPVFSRVDFQRSKNITANIDASLTNSFEANGELRKLFADLKPTYPDVSLVYGGEEEATKESLESLFSAMLIAIIAIFAIMVFIFNSYIKPFIIMTTIPLGLTGFSIAFYFHNKPVSFFALIGIVGLAGIIVNSGIVLISFIEEMRDRGELPLSDILAKASAMRLRAVLVTSLTTISGLFPTAYGIGGTDPMLVPMTLAMAWGLTSGTILTLVWIPCAYKISEDIVDIPSKIALILGRFRSRLTSSTAS